MICLKDILESDNAQIFALNDISDDIEISTNSGNRRTVKGSMQSDLVNFSANAGVNAPLLAYAAKLYIQTPIDIDLCVGGLLTVDGKPYKIADKREEMGVLELSLNRAGRW